MKNTLRPRMRGRGTQPAISNVTISGPYNIKGPGDTPSRRRIFVCAPSSDADLACATKILHDAGRAGRTAVPPPTRTSSGCCRSSPPADPKADSIAAFNERSSGSW